MVLARQLQHQQQPVIRSSSAIITGRVLAAAALQLCFLSENTPSSLLGPSEPSSRGVDCPSEFYRSIIPISVGKQIFLLFPLDFRSTYGPDSSPFFDP